MCIRSRVICWGVWHHLSITMISCRLYRVRALVCEARIKQIMFITRLKFRKYIICTLERRVIFYHCSIDERYKRAIVSFTGDSRSWVVATAMTAAPWNTASVGTTTSSTATLTTRTHLLNITTSPVWSCSAGNLYIYRVSRIF